MKNVILFGAPGAGKGTQSKLLLEKYDFAYISTGELLRNEIKQGTELGKQAENIINQGKLVSDELIISLISSFIEKNNTKGILLDGFPRTVKQAEALDDILEKLHRGCAKVIQLEVPKDVLIKRLLKRAEIEGRVDDNEQTIKKRFEEYSEKTAPVAEYYKKQNAYVEVDGFNGTIADITARLCKEIDAI